MKIQQENLPYRPITLKLEKRSEAEALLRIMDMICDCYASENREITPNMIGEKERKMAVEISNAFTECKVST